MLCIVCAYKSLLLIRWWVKQEQQQQRQRCWADISTNTTAAGGMVVEDQGQVMLISVHDETDSFFLFFVDDSDFNQSVNPAGREKIWWDMLENCGIFVSLGEHENYVFFRDKCGKCVGGTQRIIIYLLINSWSRVCNVNSRRGLPPSGKQAHNITEKLRF